MVLEEVLKMDALLVLNPQNSFFSEGGSVYMGNKSYILRIRLKDYMSSFSKPKIFFREKHALDDEFFANDKTHSIATSNDFQVHDDLKPYADLFYDKTRYSALYNTQLDEYLKRNCYKEIGLVGVETHTSILFTAEDLRNRGYDVTVIEPCVVARDNFFHDSAINLMRNFLGVKIANE